LNPRFLATMRLYVAQIVRASSASVIPFALLVELGGGKQRCAI
jgi:hypothetical protein